jgi:hypothetical protein
LCFHPCVVVFADSLFTCVISNSFLTFFRVDSNFEITLLYKSATNSEESYVIPFAQHLFTKKSFMANDQLFRYLSKLSPEADKGIIPNRGLVDYKPPWYGLDGKNCRVGKLYYHNLVMVVGRIHVCLPEKLREGPPPKTGSCKQNDIDVVTDSSKPTCKHDKKSGFLFEEKQDNKCLNGGSLCLSFQIPVSILSLFMHYGVFKSQRKLSMEFEKEMVTVFTPSYICQPNINHRKITKQAMDESIDLKTDTEDRDMIDQRSFINTGLGHDKSSSFATEDYTAFGYEAKVETLRVPSTDLLALESVVTASSGLPCGLVKPLHAGVLKPDLLWAMLVELCGMKKEREEVLPPQLAGPNENPQHLATYYLHVIMCKVSEQFNRLEDNENWVSLYTHLLGIAKNRKEEDLQLYFPKSSSFDDLTPACYPELRHKVFYLFSLLYPSGKPALLDGVGRVFSATHSLARVRFPVKGPLYGYTGMDLNEKVSTYPGKKPWYPLGGDNYLKATSATCSLNLISMGVESFDSGFGTLCRDQSNAIQRIHSSHRPQTMNDWLLLVIVNLLAPLPSKQFQRTDKVHSRFIGHYENPEERHRKLLPSTVDIPKGPTYEKIIEKFGIFRQAKSKANSKPMDIVTRTDQLDNWKDSVQEFLISGTKTRLDKRNTNGENVSPLPYLDKHPAMSIYCPGVTYNEWLGFYSSLMARIMTLSFTNKSKYLETCLTSMHKGTSMEVLNWAYAVGATNKFMLEFEIKNHLFKPTWKIQYLRLFYLIASCCVHNHNFKELKKERRESVDARTMLEEFFRTTGIGSFSPKLAAGCLISVDNYVMAPLKLAIKEEREFARFQVRVVEVFCVIRFEKHRETSLCFLPCHLTLDTPPSFRVAL